jgi:hypothetical protein
MTLPHTQPHLGRGPGYDRPDFSYLEDLPMPPSQAYEDDVYVHSLHPDQILPRLSEEDGLYMGPDGKWHSVGVIAASSITHGEAARPLSTIYISKNSHIQ